MKNLVTLVAFAFLPGLIFTQTPGTLVASFGNNGSVFTDFGGASSYCNTSDIQADQKIILAGYTLSGPVSNISFLRYMPDGSLDPSFGNDGFITHVFGGSDEYINDVIAMEDGKILACGYTNSSGKAQMILLRLNADGSFDNSFSNDGMQLIDFGPSYNAYGMSMVLNEDDQIILVGYVVNNSLENNAAFCRVNPNGNIDLSFGTNGLVIMNLISQNNYTNCVNLQGDKILIGGLSYEGGTGFVTLSRYDANGILDASFGVNGIVSIEMEIDVWLLAPKGAMCLDDQERILFGCYVQSIMDSEFAVLRFLEDGTPDNSFGDYGMTVTEITGYASVHAITTQYDGKILACGYNLIDEEDYDFCMVRYLENGNPDPAFGINSNGIVISDISPAGTFNPDDRITDVHINDDGEIVTTGISYSNAGGSDFAAAMYYSGLNVGVNQASLEDKNNVIISPVPFRASLSIEMKGISEEDIVIKMTDLTGKTVLQKNIPAILCDQKISLKTDHLRPGFYLLNCILPNKTFCRKILKAD